MLTETCARAGFPVARTMPMPIVRKHKLFIICVTLVLR